jgi:aryl-alcohol dehydrogenase-like predicted oxidoreductase
VSILAWSPLVADLAGRYGSADASEPMPALAQRLSMTNGQLALLWPPERPGVGSAIIGPRSVVQVDGSRAVLDVAPLDQETLSTLDAIVPPHSEGTGARTGLRR